MDEDTTRRSSSSDFLILTLQESYCVVFDITYSFISWIKVPRSLGRRIQGGYIKDVKYLENVCFSIVHNINDTKSNSNFYHTLTLDIYLKCIWHVKKFAMEKLFLHLGWKRVNLGTFLSTQPLLPPKKVGENKDEGDGLFDVAI